MVYDWGDKQETCYRMYVAERRSLDEVIKFFKEEVGFVPSKRAFQTQFRRWGFPSKQNPAHRNEALVARTRELWQKNTTQKDMVNILHAEGFKITERELMRLRSKHRLLLRGANKVKTGVVNDDRATAEDFAEDEVPMQPYQSDLPFVEPFESGQSSKGKGRLDELQKESNERWESKRRRRRTRGWAGLPADPPGPPRFPSETTLDFSKTCLGLDNCSYLEVRTKFQEICQEHGIVKKTTAGPELWQAAKDQLMQSHVQLQQVFGQSDPLQVDQMRLSLDVICMDVTKRMRNMEHQMTLAEAKNMLNINPEEGRNLRQALMDLLAANNFVNKYESDNWDQLKQQWIVDSGLGDRIPPPGDSNRDRMLRAVQAICRDIMKRWRDAQVAQGNVKVVNRVKDGESSEAQSATRLDFDARQMSSQGQNAQGGRVVDNRESHQNEPTEGYDFQIDPTLLMAARENAYVDGVNASFGEPLRASDSQSSVYFLNDGRWKA